jgi:aminoglycoside phosphotransferase family enzyme/adenylate kinase family enzyme
VPNDDRPYPGCSWQPWADVAETATAAVYFAGDLAFKVKKPLGFGYVDFSSVEARQKACAAEVRLNRRLAPDVYLGVVDLRGSDGVLLDHAVLMRRMPGERRLSELLHTDPECARLALHDIAGLLARLHADAAVVDGGGSPGSPAGLRALWDDEVTGLAGLGGEVIPLDVQRRLATHGNRYLSGRTPLLERRLEAGLVRDGHGDLLADDIFLLPDGPRILDCLDFDERLRVSDTWLDAAFLAMDLERLGFPALATEFLDAFRAASGTDAPASLVHFFIAYRAHIRAKVAVIRAAQGQPGASASARQLAALCRRHLEAGAVTATLVGGLPGSGKSTLAAALAERTGAVHLSTDALRPPTPSGRSLDANAAALDTGRYTPQARHGVYDDLLRRAADELGMGRSVVLDATWREPAEREAAREVAQRTAAVLTEIECVVDERLATRWLGQRVTGPSEATLRTRQQMAKDFAQWPQARRVHTAAGDPATRAALLVQRAVRSADGSGEALRP